MLKDKCINFEQSINELSMTLNHNADVTENYLYLTYAGTDYDGFQYIKPSEQLGKLTLEELEDKDYIDIINNFIKNTKENFVTINHNTELIRTWLNDYDPSTEGHEYIDLIFDMEEIKGNKTSEELEEIIDKLIDKVKQEVIPINNNIEMLIERF